MKEICLSLFYSPRCHNSWAGLDRAQTPRTQSGLPIWEAETQSLEPLSATFQMFISRDLELEMEMGFEYRQVAMDYGPPKQYLNYGAKYTPQELISRLIN